MEPSGICPACQRPLSADTPLGGVCPQCLLKSGYYSGSMPEDTAGLFVAPGIEELGVHFPQLEILDLIGRGGMGAVYRARQPRLNRLVALKVLGRNRNDDARFADRFLREAQALAQMNHPNIVTVHDFGEAGGHFYLLMEYVDGLNLRELERSKKLSPAEALAIVPGICDALQYAHQQGIVHRDIKPENILIDKQGRVKIADFGIAKLLGVTAPDEPLTGEQQRVGTPLYMAPEQVERPTTVDHRADIYSLGVVFYEMLTGELPLGRFAPPSKKVQVDVRLDEIVLRALEKEPELRFQQISEIKTQVQTLGDQSLSSTAKQPGGELSVSRKNRQDLVLGFWVALSLVTVVAFIWPRLIPALWGTLRPNVAQGVLWVSILLLIAGLVAIGIHKGLKRLITVLWILFAVFFSLAFTWPRLFPELWHKARGRSDLRANNNLSRIMEVGNNANAKQVSHHAAKIVYTREVTSDNYLNLDNGNLVSTTHSLTADQRTSLGVHLYRSPFQSDQDTLTAQNLKYTTVDPETWNDLDFFVNSRMISSEVYWKEDTTLGALRPGVYLFDTGRHLGMMKLSVSKSDDGQRITVEYRYGT